jgi:hypothetical protein
MRGSWIVAFIAYLSFVFGMFLWDAMDRSIVERNIEKKIAPYPVGFFESIAVGFYDITHNYMVRFSWRGQEHSISGAEFIEMAGDRGIDFKAGVTRGQLERRIAIYDNQARLHQYKLNSAGVLLGRFLPFIIPLVFLLLVKGTSRRWLLEKLAWMNEAYGGSRRLWMVVAGSAFLTFMLVWISFERASSISYGLFGKAFIRDEFMWFLLAPACAAVITFLVYRAPKSNRHLRAAVVNSLLCLVFLWLLAGSLPGAALVLFSSACVAGYIWLVESS